MDEKNLVKLADNYSPTRAKSFKVKTLNKDFSQYVNTIKAYALAGMPFEHIANAGDFLGDSVERAQLDAPLLEGFQGKVGEIVEDESKILSWQNRGEVISITHQLASPEPVTGQELVPTSQHLTTQSKEQKMNVLEGIAVSKEPQNLTNSPQDTQLESNPYLKAIPQTINRI